LASQLARLFLSEIVAPCTHGIDLHTAAPPRINHPQIRGNLEDPETLRCAQAFGAPIMLHGAAPKGTLRNAATARGIPVLLYEAGESLRFNETAIETGVEGVLRVMAALHMIRRSEAPRRATSLRAERSAWVRALQSGVLYQEVSLGQRVRAHQRLGVITDPFGETRLEITAPFAGMVIGQTTSALVHRGDAVVHVAAIR